MALSAVGDQRREDRLIKRTLLALLLAGFGGAACDRGESAGGAETAVPVEFATGTVRIETDADTIRMTVELAETEAQRAFGLMRRESLPADAGMLFLYADEQPAEGSFWMFNTLIPLDIAFIGEDGTIGSIVQMEPCTSPYPQWCPGYTAGVPFRAALEVNRGFFAARGIEVGDRVVLER